MTTETLRRRHKGIPEGMGESFYSLARKHSPISPKQLLFSCNKRSGNTTNVPEGDGGDIATTRLEQRNNNRGHKNKNRRRH